MSKQRQLLELRQELALAYRDELNRIQKLINGGISRIENPEAFVFVTGTKSLVLNGEAGQVFRDEVGDSVLLALERYERNLQKEMSRLGLESIAADRGREVQPPVSSSEPKSDADQLSS